MTLRSMKSSSPRHLLKKSTAKRPQSPSSDKPPSPRPVPPMHSQSTSDSSGCILVLLPDKHGSLSLYADPCTTVGDVLKSHPSHALSPFSDPRFPNRGCLLPPSETLLLGCTYQLVSQKAAPRGHSRPTPVPGTLPHQHPLGGYHVAESPRTWRNVSAPQPFTSAVIPRRAPPRRLLRAHTEEAQRAKSNQCRAQPCPEPLLSPGLHLIRSLTQQPEAGLPFPGARAHTSNSQEINEQLPVHSPFCGDGLGGCNSTRAGVGNSVDSGCASESSSDCALTSHRGGLPASASASASPWDIQGLVDYPPQSGCGVKGGVEKGDCQGMLIEGLPKAGLKLVLPCRDEPECEVMFDAPMESPAQHRRAMLTLGGRVPAP